MQRWVRKGDGVAGGILRERGGGTVSVIVQGNKQHLAQRKKGWGWG